MTAILKGQQKLCDQMYQDAIEANFSHEQMTPLNSILSNSKIVYHTLFKLMEEDKFEDEDSLRLLRVVRQSGMIMWYFN